MRFLSFPRIPTCSTRDLQEALSKRPVIIDVREKTEYQRGHIPTAKNIPLKQISRYKETLDGEVFVVCQSGMRSKQATKQLLKMGYAARNVRGGMNQWRGTVKEGKY